jgi:hypothetical protein
VRVYWFERKAATSQSAPKAAAISSQAVDLIQLWFAHHYYYLQIEATAEENSAKIHIPIKKSLALAEDVLPAFV